MDALVPALVAALLAGIGDRPAWLAARIGTRFGAGWLMGAPYVAAMLVAAAVAVAGGMLVGPLLNPHAKALLLALALVATGISALLRPDPTKHVPRIGGPIMAWLDMIGVAIGDRTSFITFALAVRGSEPILAGVGAVTGGAVLGLAALVLGEVGWRTLPLRGLASAGGLLLLATGIILGLSGLRLI